MEHVNADILFFLERIQDFSGLKLLTFKQLVSETSEDVALRILARFSISLQEAGESIERGIAEDNAEAVWRACHKLVGTAELLGFHEFGLRAKYLNQNIQAAGEISHFRTELAELQSGISILRDQIRVSFPHLKKYF